VFVIATVFLAGFLVCISFSVGHLYWPINVVAAECVVSQKRLSSLSPLFLLLTKHLRCHYTML